MNRVSIWEIGQKARCPKESNLEASFDGLFDPSFDRQPGLERFVQRFPRGRAAGQFVGELYPAGRGNDDGLDGVADLNFNACVWIDELLEVDGRLALAADVHERNVRSQLDDFSFDLLALAEELGLERLLQHPREIFFLLRSSLVLLGRLVRHDAHSSPNAPRRT